MSIIKTASAISISTIATITALSLQAAAAPAKVTCRTICKVDRKVVPCQKKKRKVVKAKPVLVKPCQPCQKNAPLPPATTIKQTVAPLPPATTIKQTVAPLPPATTIKKEATSSTPSTKLQLSAIYNTQSQQTTPEVSISTTGPTKIRLYAGLGRTGSTTTIGANILTNRRPGLQYIKASHEDRSVFYWQNGQTGLIENAVKDRVFTDAECAEKRQWAEKNGHKWFGGYTLKAGQTQYATSTQDTYTKQPDTTVNHNGITAGIEAEQQILGPLSANVGIKVQDGIRPTYGASVDFSENVGIGARFVQGAGVDVRGSVGFEF